VPRYARPMTIPAAPADPLGDALHLMRMSGAFYCRARFSAPWALRLPAFKQSLMFHVVTAGRCTLAVEGAACCDLQRGDLVLVPHGRGHVLASALDVAPVNLFDLPRQQLSDRYEQLQHGGGGDVTSMICGAVSFDDPAALRLVEALPPVITVDSSEAPNLDWLQSTVRLLALEARELRPGGEAVITRLADVLVIHAIRSWIERDPVGQTGWLRALRDQQIGRALTLIHREPARAWTVGELASSVAMSRSAFAARFATLVGEPVMQYATRWRMQLALGWLQRDDAPLAEIAGRLGYESEAGFSRSFKRLFGTSPGEVRVRHREGAAHGAVPRVDRLPQHPERD
jgi:AraC-like DNA-binding protein